MAHDQYNNTDKFCATAAQSAMVGMLIGGRAARACDVCGKERARWYCAADLAYLCERCDGAVHSANPLAGRHERARLGPNGAPVKTTRTLPAVNVKREASAAVSPDLSSAHFNPRKRPRSIRRHKPSSFHASKHVISLSIPASNNNYISSHASNYYNYTGSILASTHGVMIDNPRSNPDFVANDLLSKAITSVKAEPYSPVDIGDQVKVPDHLDDDHLLESLFDFRDLQDDDLFLHQVPVYDPLKSQDLSPTLNHSVHCLQGADQGQEYEEKKSFINSTSPVVDSDQCASTHSSELYQAEESKGLSFGVNDDAPSLSECDDGDKNRNIASLSECDDGNKNLIDPNNDICDLDQLDFDCVLHENDDDSDDMNHAASMDMDVDSHDFIEVYPDHETTEDSGFAEVSYNHHGNCKLDGADGQYNGEHHASYVEGFDFDASGSDSPRTWLCKVKVESPPELGINMQGQHGDVYDDAMLMEKLTCKNFSADSPHTFKLGLKLNFEDVLSSWSDRGTFWADGHRPSQVGNCLDFLGGYFVPEMNGTGTDKGEGQQLVPAFNHKNKRSDDGAREASVLRYREKRRTRLFSKKIRYEVRKLNAEKRPRMKGRFVKRMTV